MKFFRTLILFILILATRQVFSQTDPVRPAQIEIRNFIVEENLLKNNKLAVIATDAEERPQENVTGTFQFSFNGFRQELKFNDGVAVAPQPVTKSTFLYLRHENESGTQGKLYFIYKKDDSLRPFAINWLILILVPAAIVILAMLFRKFIIIAGILLIILFFFNSTNGLDLQTFFDTIVDGLRNLV